MDSTSIIEKEKKKKSLVYLGGQKDPSQDSRWILHYCTLEMNLKSRGEPAERWTNPK
jgi:hypothetical protein